ncbi:recombinase zinc beta ribbon domain-containing protein [Trueperella pyogenes]
MTKTIKVNEGEVPQYYVTGNHEPIISPATWDAVQAELARRAGKGTSSTHPFANKIKCSDCGGWFGRKVWHSTSKYRRVIWRCNNKYKKTHCCATPHVTEDQTKNAFVAALTERVTGNGVLDDTMRLLDESVYNTRELETQQAELGERIEETITLMNQVTTTAAATAHDPDDYDRRYHELENRHRQLETEHHRISEQIDDLRHRRAQAIKVRDYLATQPPLAYSDQAWNTLVDHATVTADGVITILLKDEISSSKD